MQDYTPNSHRFKEEQKTESKAVPAEREKAKKVVSGTVTTKKKSKFASLFADDVVYIKDYIVKDVFIPNAKETIWDIFTNSLEMVLFKGEKRGKTSSGSKISYRSYYEQPNNGRRYVNNERDNKRFDYDELVFEDRGEAERVIDEMQAMIDNYDRVSVADMYDAAGLTAPQYTANKYGWTSVAAAEVIRVRGGGYVIKLPRAVPI